VVDFVKVFSPSVRDSDFQRKAAARLRLPERA
jgi:hypothetical protein